MRGLLLIVLMLTVGNLLCQNSSNLVPNFDFEELNKCPQTKKTWKTIVDWYSPKDNFDVFNSCNKIGGSFPENDFGYQEPFSGNGYVGLKFYNVFEFSNSNYIQVKLKKILKSGVKYKVSFHVSLAEKSGYSIDGIGCLISKEEKIVRRNPQVYNLYGNVVNETDSWTKIDGEFIADGGEKYLSIGNFYTTDKVTQFIINENSSESYYYIDKVSLEEIPIENNGNLVLNGGFEMFSLCSSTNQSAINYCINWNKTKQKISKQENITMEKGVTGTVTQFNNGLLGSPDYYNLCSRDTLTPEGSRIPLPKSGMAFAGINLYSNNGKLRGCEYLQTQLTSPLQKDVTYKIKMYVMLSENSKTAMNTMGVVLSEEQLTKSQQEQKTPIKYEPITYTEKVILTNKKKWQLLEGEYIAKGGEIFITIGDFDSESNDTEIQMLDSGKRKISYYYIDDLSVLIK